MPRKSVRKEGRRYYMISAVSKRMGVHPQTLRLYERDGLLTPSRTEGNTRLYTDEDLEQLEIIMNLTRNLAQRLLPGGTLYIGNMVPHIPSRWIMELHLDWYLIFRTHDEMIAFAQEAAPDDEVFILPESTGFNPFVCVRRASHG